MFYIQNFTFVKRAFLLDLKYKLFLKSLPITNEIFRKLKMKVVMYRKDGKTYWNIVNEQYLPVNVLISHYLQVYLGNKSANTKKRKAYDLLFALTYFESMEINLIQRIESFELLTEPEINSFFKSCKLKKEVVATLNTSSLITNTGLRNLIARNLPTNNLVETDTAKERADTFLSFLSYVYERRHGRYILIKEQEAIYRQFKINLATARNSMGNWSKKTNDPIESRLPDEKYFELLEIIKPNNAKNPFKGSKLRNEIIVKLIIETGIRRGAVAKLKISDVFNDKSPRIRVTRTPDDVTDPRKNRPSQKTKSHVAAISPDLAQRIEYYIINVRKNLPKSVEHEFVFVSEKNSKTTLGNPLSLESINSIFSKLSQILEVNITPHMLRHKWNEIFDDGMTSLARDMGFDSKRIEDVRKYAMGWSAKSEMAEVYNAYKIACIARDYHLQRQREQGRKLAKEYQSKNSHQDPSKEE